jgi:sodium-independent sulfate anion transporter 11
MSLEVARVIQHVNEQYPGLYSGPQIATNLAFSCGLIVLVIGMLRIAWIVDFIPAPALSGFMTGSAISISCTQIPGLFGVQDRFESAFLLPACLQFLLVDMRVSSTRAAPFRVIIDTLMNLQYSSKDAIIGIFGITG